MGDRRYLAAQPKPVSRRDIARRDRDEARQPRLGGKKVVAIHVEPVFGNQETDRQQPAAFIEQEVELHGARHGPRRCLDREQSTIQIIRHPGGQGVAMMAGNRAVRRLDPEQHVGALRIGTLARERTREVDGGFRHRQCRFEADRRPGQGCRQPVERPNEFGAGDEMSAAIVGQRRQSLAGEGETVGRAARAIGLHGASCAPGATGVGKRDQVSGEVAAIHRRDVARLEGTQITRVVPVEEVSPKPLQPLHRREGGFKALHRLGGADPAELAGSGRRKEQQTEIGRRRAMRHDGRRRLLEVVRRQHVVRFGDERLEEAPGLPRNEAQRGRLGGLDPQAAGITRRTAHPVGHRGRQQPGQHERGGDRHRRAAGQPDHASGDDRDHDASRHLAIEARPPGPYALLGLGGGDPFEKAAMADHEPEQGPADRVGHQPGMVTHEDDEQARLQGRRNDIAPQRIEMTAGRDLRMSRKQGRDRRQKRGQRDDQQHEARPDQRGREGQHPTRQQGDDRRRRR